MKEILTHEEIRQQIAKLHDVFERAQAARAWGHSEASVKRNTEVAIETKMKITALRVLLSENDGEGVIE